MRIDLPCPEMYRGLALGCIRDNLFNFLDQPLSSLLRNLMTDAAYQVVKDTFVKLPFLGSALPELLIVVVKAGPVLAKLRETMLVHVLDPGENY